MTPQQNLRHELSFSSSCVLSRRHERRRLPFSEMLKSVILHRIAIYLIAIYLIAIYVIAIYLIAIYLIAIYLIAIYLIAMSMVQRLEFNCLTSLT